MRPGSALIVMSSIPVETARQQAKACGGARHFLSGRPGFRRRDRRAGRHARHHGRRRGGHVRARFGRVLEIDGASDAGRRCRLRPARQAASTSSSLPAPSPPWPKRCCLPNAAAPILRECARHCSAASPTRRSCASTRAHDRARLHSGRPGEVSGEGHQDGARASPAISISTCRYWPSSTDCSRTWWRMATATIDHSGIIREMRRRNGLDGASIDRQVHRRVMPTLHRE